MSQNLPEHLSEYEVRLLKEKELRKIESSLWGTAIKPSMKIKDAKFLNEEDYSKFISFAGRIIGKREHGKSIFITIRDSSDVIQCYIKNEENISVSLCRVAVFRSICADRGASAKSVLQGGTGGGPYQCHP